MPLPSLFQSRDAKRRIVSFKNCADWKSFGSGYGGELGSNYVFDIFLK